MAPENRGPRKEVSGLQINGSQSEIRGYHEHLFSFQCQEGLRLTPSTIVQLAWAIVTSRHTGSDDIVYGLSETVEHHLHGALPIKSPYHRILRRIQFRPDKSIAENAFGIQTRGKHGDHSFIDDAMFHMVIDAHVKQQTHPNVLFDECNAGRNDVLPGCNLHLIITLQQDQHQSRMALKFDETVFDENMIKSMGHQFEHVVAQICRDPDRLLMTVQLFNPWDHDQLATWNSTTLESYEACIHELVLEQCKLHKQVTAISSWDGDLSYGELDYFSSLLSQYLTTIGVRVSTVVPLVFEKSKWLPVAVLAVLRSGGVCVPLDPSQPEARLATILQDTKAQLALASVGYQGLLRSVETVVEVSDSFWTDIDSQVCHQRPTVSPSDQAFIFYTSGSTGKPKGVVMQHRSTATGMRNLNARMNVHTGLRVLHFASYAFDASMHEILNAFTTGGCLCIPSSSERAELASYMMRERITWAILTPSISATLRPSDVPTLETLVSTGEAMSRSTVDAWSSKLTLINAFGPTETAFCCAVEHVRPNRRPGSVGFVVNGRGWVTRPGDPSRLCAIGEVGELLIEGPALAQGYLHDTEKTAAAFTAAPLWRGDFPGSAGCRLYHTGDLVRYNGDGSILFIGRQDTQVKVRGQRVELGDVEYHVESCIGPDIAVAAEVITPSSSGKSTLVAFLAIRHTATQTSQHSSDAVQCIRRLVPSDLRKKLEQVLPPHMMPTIFVPLQQIPLTASGKTDRRLLRQMGQSLKPSQLADLWPDRRSFRAAATQMEQRLATIFAVILSMDASDISADDSFLRIGGDSISVLRLVSRARSRGFSFTAADVFKSPRLSELASFVSANVEAHEVGTIAPFSLLDSRVDELHVRDQAAKLCGLASGAAVLDIYPCTPLQEGLLAATMKSPGSYVSRELMQLQDNVDVSQFKKAWEQVILATPILRTRIVNLPEQGLVQAVVDELPKWTIWKDKNSFLENKQENPMMMGIGQPLTDFSLILDCDGKRYFAWTKHHATFDGWTVPLILTQLQAAYQNQNLSTLTPFQDYINYISHPGEDSYVFWEDQFRDSHPVSFPALPSVGYQPRADHTIQHKVSSLHWPRGVDITPSTIVRAAWAILEAQYTNSTDVVFGATVTGRNAPIPGIDKLAGPTITAVPVRVVVDWEETVGETLWRIQQQAIDMMPFEHTGLQRIQKISHELLQKSRFQTLLVVQPAHDRLAMDGYKSGLFHRAANDTWGDDDLETFNSYSLMLECQLEADGVELRLSCDSQVVPPRYADRLIRQMDHLLNAVCSENAFTIPTRDIATISRKDLVDIWTWNETAPIPADVTVPDLIAGWARDRPEAPAVCAWDGEMVYADLEKLSTQLAHVLASMGVGRNTVVPLCFEKSIWTPVAMLSVIKTGAAIVAIDITQPRDRLRLIVQEVEPVMLLSSEDAAGLAADLSSAPVMRIGPGVYDFLHTEGQISFPAPTIRPSDTLYIAFTSGSTGKPKGVIINHQNITTALYHQPGIFGLSPNARLFDFASYSFDVSLLNFFYTLSHGACLCVPSSTLRRDNITKSMQQLSVTTACLTPSVARLIEPEAVPTLRCLALAGEPMEWQDVTRWASHVDLTNVYGPTETISSTIKSVDERCYEVGNIGRGHGLTTWIVTLSGDRLAPIGAVGELWLEGPLVGGGYLGEPQKTATSFTQDLPWLLRGDGHAQPGRSGRAYRTGDLARYTPDGEIILVGRKDEQVKIRGQRVELGEVEHHIQRALAQRGLRPSVAVEVVKPLNAAHSVLVGYFGIGEEAESSADNVRLIMQSLVGGLQQLLSDHLPSYMIPGFYMAVDHIPLTASGKKNRRILRQKGEILTLEKLVALQPAAVISSHRRDPKTDVERQLQELWASVLGVKADKIGMASCFFELGGDSIAAMRLVSVARNQGLSFTVSDVFKNRRLCDLVGVVQQENLHYSAETASPAFSLLPPNVARVHMISCAAAQCGVLEDQIEDVFPCTAFQLGVLSMTMKKPHGYIDRGIYRLGEEVDAKRFQDAWDEVISSLAPILRTRVVDLPDLGLMQAVVKERVEWNTAPNLQSYLQQDKQKSMGLGTSLSRFALVQDSESNKHFVWTRHHAIYDGWAVPLMLGLASKVYHNHEIEPPTPFRNFIQFVMQTNHEQAKRYWQSQLQELDSALFPPVLSSHQPHADRNAQYHISNVPWLHHAVTPSTVMRAAWAILMAQYTNTSDVVFGAVVTGRTAPVPGICGMAGPTIATVPVRIKIDADNTNVMEFLKRTQQQVVDMIPFEQVGLKQIARFCQDANHDSSPTDLFQTLLVVQPTNPTDVSNPGVCSLNLTEEDLQPEDAMNMNSFNPYALMIECQLENNGVALQLSFDSHTIEETQIFKMTQQLDHILHQLCERPEALLHEIFSTSPTALEEIWTWNAKVPPSIQTCVHDIIAKQALKSADAPAVCAWDGSLTYGELEDLSTRLAHHLDSYGVHNTVVALCFEKSLWTPVSMLGVMKAGGASVALDMSQPEERLRSVLRQAKVGVLLCSAKYSKTVEKLGVQSRVIVEAASLQHLNPPYCKSLPLVDPSNRLYVVFTSGSTGTPKGVVINHANFSSAIKYQQHFLGFNGNARVFDFASNSFDAVWSNFLHTVSSGGCLCIPSDSSRKDDIGASIIQLRATYADLTPSTARLIHPSTTTLNTLVLAGEPIADQDIATWASRLTLMNTYGPAECSVTATASAKLRPNDKKGNIGRGLGLVAWIVEPSKGRELVPIGATGELWLEGPLIGDGYLGDNEKTRASFVQDPAWLVRGATNHPGRRGRLYKTGDLVRYNMDGTISFVARKDDGRVKIRGQLVEVSEIEHAIRQRFPGIRDVVVDVFTAQGEEGRSTLAAFLSVQHVEADQSDASGRIIEPPTSTFQSLSQTIETHLSTLLPIYMVPAIYIPLRRIPTLESGKTDRRYLRELWASLSKDEIRSYNYISSTKQKPTNEMEAMLLHLWARILNLNDADVGINDSFFKLGGDSISAMQLSSKCRAAGLDVTVSQIFQHKSIAKLALSVTIRSSPDVLSATVEEQTEIPFPLSPIQQFFFDIQPPDRLNHFHQSFSLRITKSLSSADLFEALKAVVERHSMFRARFTQAPNGAWSQLITNHVDSSFRYRHHKGNSLSEAVDIIEEAKSSLDIGSGPLLAVDLIDMQPHGQYLSLVAHHLVIDLVSWRIVIEDLESILVGSSPITVASTPFQVWCHMQARYSLQNLTPKVALPVDVPAPLAEYWGVAPLQRNTYGDIRQRSFAVEKEVTSSLLGSANDAFRTEPVDILQSALIHSFMAVFPGRSLPTIFNEGHGREPWDSAIDLSRTVGWFTTMWPSHVSLNHGADLLDIIRHTKDSRRSVPRKGWAYFASRYLNPEGHEAFAVHDQKEILFNFEGNYQQLERPGALFHREDTGLDERFSAAMQGLNRAALIEVFVTLKGGCFQFSFHFNRHMDHQDALDKWVMKCLDALKEAAHDLIRELPTYTPSDFPLLHLGHDELSRLVKETLPQAGILPAKIDDMYPCTPTQELMLRAHVRQSNLYRTTSTNEVRAFGVSPGISITRLMSAWKALLKRITSLRTVFIPIRDGLEWIQVVLKDIHAEPEILASGCSDEHALQYMAAHQPASGQTFQLPAHLTFCQTSTGRILFKLDINHAIMDAASRALLFDRWSREFAGEPVLRGEPLYSNLIDHVHSERGASTEYWTKYLKHAPSCLFPTAYISDCDSLVGLGTVRCSFEKSNALLAFSRRSGFTVATLFKAAWALVLRHYLEQDWICFGYFDSGRHEQVPDIQHLIGAVASILVCRVEIGQSTSLCHVLQAIQDNYHESLPHQHGAMHAVHVLNLSPPSRHLFNTLVNYRKDSSTAAEHKQPAGVQFDLLSAEDGMEFDLVFNIDDLGDKLQISLDFWRTRISESAATQICSLVQTVLATIIDNVDKTAVAGIKSLV